MYYRLTHINDQPLPARCVIATSVHEIGHGGLLLEGNEIEISAEDTVTIFPPKTRFRFVAAPDDPIPADWSESFNFGGPNIHSIEPEPDAATRAAILEWLEQEQQNAGSNAARRLKRAWTSTP